MSEPETLPDGPPATHTSPPRGWYIDPKLAPRERWWTGTEWSEFTHRKASKTLFGPDYQRYFWPGPNRSSTKAWIFSLVTVGLYAAAFITNFVGISATEGQPKLETGIVVAIAGLAAVVSGILAIVYGIRATRAAAREGGTGLAVVGLIVGFSGGVFGLAFIGFGVLIILSATGRL